ncbi:MAG: 50S ribosomal protein L10 [Thermoprotei archaeon]|nr:MAG: 50S ribosomal protein L10 [Thermoprotei archaeon]
MSRVVGYVRTRPYPERKVKRIEEYASLLKRYKYVLLVDIVGVPAPALHEARRALRERGAVLKVIKNTLFAKALEKVADEKPGLLALKEKLKGQNAAIFTDENPFSTLLFLRRYKVSREARPGDKATSDIVIPSGNTGFAPGPIISLFNKLRIPIRIQEGSIWVASDTVVARKGDTISPELAELLNKMGLKPIEMSLQVKVLLVDGRAVEPEEVEVEPEAYEEMVAEAHSRAVNLALNACLPVREVADLLVAKAHFEAMALAVSAAIPVPGALEAALARASAEARALYELVKSQSPEFG